MITFPCCKINLGLNVVSLRSDGYHDIETVFYPIPLCDALEITPMHPEFPSETPCDLMVTGTEISGDTQSNLVVKAYNLLAKDFALPHLHIHLHKRIPLQAGLGGGSSDAANMICLLNRKFELNLDVSQMRDYAAKLGADCPFFITNEISYATGIGEVLSPIKSDNENLNGYYVVIVKPDVAVSTAEAYAQILPMKPMKNVRQIVKQPIDTWKDHLHNDFEMPVFAKNPTLKKIKDDLYRLGARYAQMTGSGSALFGIFGRKPVGVEEAFPNDFVYVCRL